MARYYQKINESGEIERVVVADSIDFCKENFPGNWEVITKKEIEANDLVFYSAFMDKLFKDNEEYNNEKK